MDGAAAGLRGARAIRARRGGRLPGRLLCTSEYLARAEAAGDANAGERLRRGLRRLLERPPAIERFCGLDRNPGTESGAVLNRASDPVREIQRQLGECTEEGCFEAWGDAGAVLLDGDAAAVKASIDEAARLEEEVARTAASC